MQSPIGTVGMTRAMTALPLAAAAVHFRFPLAGWSIGRSSRTKYAARASTLPIGWAHCWESGDGFYDVSVVACHIAADGKMPKALAAG